MYGPSCMHAGQANSVVVSLATCAPCYPSPSHAEAALEVQNCNNVKGRLALLGKADMRGVFARDV